MKSIAIVVVGFLIGSCAFNYAAKHDWFKPFPEAVPRFVEFNTPDGMHCVKTDRALSCIDNREYAK